MNKLTNVLLLMITFPILALTIIVGRDLPLEMLKTSGANLPFKEVIFSVLAVIIFLIVFKRSLKRWIGMKLLLQSDKYVYNVEVSKVRKQRVILYTILESAVLLSLSYALLQVSQEAVLISFAYGLGVIDSWMFCAIGVYKKGFRVGITKKAMVLADRDVRAVYFLGLRKLSISQDTLYFDYIKDLKLHAPINAVENQKELLVALLSQTDDTKVFVEESIKRIID
ncbi:MAG: hypothetical protein ACI9G9_000214 [Psychromonas sp.]|jgi:hypothetical protein